MGYRNDIPATPTIRVKKKAVQRLYPSELEKILKECDHPVYRRQEFIIKVMVGLGIRPYEMDMMTWEWIDLPRRIITIPHNLKPNKKGGVIPIPDEVFNLLLPIANKKGRLCPYNSGYYVKVIARLSKSIGIHFTAGTFRKTFASIMFANGVTIETVALILRNDYETTKGWYLEFEADYLRDPMSFNPLRDIGAKMGAKELQSLSNIVNVQSQSVNNC